MANRQATKLKLQLYMHHVGEPDLATRDQITVLSPNGTQGFGAFVVNDIAVHEGPTISSKIVARALGRYAQCSKTGGQWNFSWSMVFKDGSYKGSSLIVTGMLEDDEWAVVGGTGELLMAQGVIRHVYMQNIGFKKLDIEIIYYGVADFKDGECSWANTPHLGSPEQLRLNLYMHHIGEPDLATRDQITVLSPNGTQGFGTFVVNDIAVHEGPTTSSKIVARALGRYAQCSKTGGQWNFSWSMVFKDGRYKGSSLIVTGMLEDDEWAVVGGTGELLMAQGVIRHVYMQNIGLKNLDIEINLPRRC